MNGWHRAWLLFCVLWVIAVIAWQAYVYFDDELILDWYLKGNHFYAALIAPCVFVYVLGWAVAWVRRGFRS